MTHNKGWPWPYASLYFKSLNGREPIKKLTRQVKKSNKSQKTCKLTVIRSIIQNAFFYILFSVWTPEGEIISSRDLPRLTVEIKKMDQMTLDNILNPMSNIFITLYQKNNAVSKKTNPQNFTFLFTCTLKWKCLPDHFKVVLPGKLDQSNRN